MPELVFHGAAREVTGSMHLIRSEAGWIALDCGLFQGRRDESEAKNRSWPVPPIEIAAVVLSHAHTDHSGKLPRLVRDGFDGPIFATPATRDLCAIMLPDSAHIQLEDIKYVNKKRSRKGLGPLDVLYDAHDALAAVKLMQTVSYNRWFNVLPGVRARFRDAGHMLGSAHVQIAIERRGGEETSLLFTGDVGRPNAPILRDPTPFPPSATVICESTYGARVNESVDEAKERIRDVVKRTYERGGKVIIPAFSVGRTQTITYFLHELMEAGEIAAHPVFVDSPLAVSASEVFKLHPECYDQDARTFHARTGDMLGNGCCTYIRDVEESIRLHARRSPCTIISASGMCETGRILHHLKNNIEKPKNTVLIPGYQAANTLGRRLADGVKKVNIFHESYDVRAEVVQIHGFSGHADQSDLMRMLLPLRDSARRVYLVHGEPDQSDALAAKLRESRFPSVECPSMGERVELM